MAVFLRFIMQAPDYEMIAAQSLRRDAANRGQQDKVQEPLRRAGS